MKYYTKEKTYYNIYMLKFFIFFVKGILIYSTNFPYFKFISHMQLFFLYKKMYSFI